MFTQNETANILAALRCFQNRPLEHRGTYPQVREEGCRAMTDSEIDTLCEKINYMEAGASNADVVLDALKLAIRMLNGIPNTDTYGEGMAYDRTPELERVLKSAEGRRQPAPVHVAEDGR